MAAPIQYLGMDAKDIKYRFNWNAPIIWSKHEPNTYYHGSQYLLKTSDMGRTWKEVSPDLTRNEKEKQGKGGGPYTNEAVGAENYGTLAYIMESPHEKGVIWTGSDDGLVYRDARRWRELEERHAERPGGMFDQCDRSVAARQGHCLHRDHALQVQRPRAGSCTRPPTTETPGRRSTTALPRNAFTRVVREDDVRRDLLFAGTELGLFISWNGGRDWSPFQLNLPITPITDLRVHKGNLIAATSGRSFWILDDLSVLRQYKKDAPSFAIYRPDGAYLVNGGERARSNGG